MSKTKEKLAIADVLEYNERVEHSTPLDESCKKVLSDKQILAWVVKDCVIEFKDVPLVTIPQYIDNYPQLNVKLNEFLDHIQSMNTEDITIPGARIYFDIVVKIRFPGSTGKEEIDLILNLEAQGKEKSEYSLLTRAVYYCSRLLARQKNEKDDFMHSEYNNLKKVYSIWIVMNASKEKEGVFNRFSLKEECLKKEYHFPKEAYDKLAIIMIYPKSDNNKHKQKYDLMDLLTLLFKSKKSAEVKKQELENNYNIKMTRELKAEVNNMCNLSEVWLDEGIALGLKKGRDEGRRLGQREGRREGVTLGLETVSNVISLMKTTNITASEALDRLDIDESLRADIMNFIETLHNN